MDVMLDLETLSTRNWATILVIGAIRFKPDNSTTVPLEKLKPSDTFYRRITIDSCKEVGLHVDEKTEAWWKTQDKSVRDEAFGKERIPLKQALVEFSTWFGDDKTKLWCQGANFDAPILDEAYRRCNLEPPWKFWNVRDTRTVYDILGHSHVSSINKHRPEFNENLHNALYDCQRQIIMLKTCFYLLYE